MQSYFNQIADFLTSQLSGEEVLTMGFSGEDSDFVRFNQSKVRQAGHVQQRYLELDLISGSRHAASVLTLSGVEEEDRSRATETVESLRKLVPDLPEDPHLLYATQVCSGEQTGDNTLPDSGDAVERILAGGAGRDPALLVGAVGVDDEVGVGHERRGGGLQPAVDWGRAYQIFPPDR